MRVLLVMNGQKLREHALTLDEPAAAPVPEPIRALLHGAPTVTGAALPASDLAAALAKWAIERDTTALCRTTIADVELDLMLLPVILLLGRDLGLAGYGNVEVSVQ